MPSYAIDLTTPSVLRPCAFHVSVEPGKTLQVLEDGSAVCVQPDGGEYYVNKDGVRLPSVPVSDPNFDSPWTRADVLDGFLVYRSSAGMPRGYKMVGA